METKRVIKSKYLPARIPTIPTLSIVMALDYWKAPQWAWGVMLTLLGIVWISAIYYRITEEEIELIETQSNGQQVKSKFMEKLENAMSKPKS